MMGRIVGVMGALAIALAALGVFAVVAYAMDAPARVRRSHGPRRSGIAATRDLVRSFAGILAAALFVGLGGAAVGLHGLRGLFYGVTPWDPLTFATAGSLVVLVTLAAVYLPARRMSRLDPAQVIRGAQG